MKIYIRLLVVGILVSGLFPGCASKRRKDKDPSAINKFYHNTTAYYNGYFNANELLEDSYLVLQQAHQDNYNEILSLYDYTTVNDPKIVYPDLDKAIEKVTKVAALHEPSEWVDDCYVLMGEAQYLKQEYETAEETFSYFKEEFNPNNPFGRNYQKKKKSQKDIRKEKEAEREAEKKAKEEERKEREKQREEEEKAREEERKAREKAREEERERRKKEREAEKKRRKKERKSRRGRAKREQDKVPETNNQEDKKTEETKPTESKIETPVIDDPKEEVVKEDTEEEDFELPEEEKKKKDKTAYSIGMIWYAKTLVKRDKLSNAAYIVKRMRDDGVAPKEALREIPVILADIAIKNKNYREAISHLDEAIELSNKKHLRSRYAFVQGQLHLELSQYADANESFSKAKKWAKSFDMEFMADMNKEKTNMLSGARSKEDVVDKLDDMAKEAKYEEYLDQIYYTKGEILLADGQFDEALKAFSRSIANNVSNIPLKQETYYNLAYLFYDREEYVEAKAYFDSTLQVLEKEDLRYNESERLANNLQDISKSIKAIEMQDSLLSMVNWSDDKIIAKAEFLVEQDRLANSGEGKGGKEEGSRKSTAILDGRGFGSSRSNFFAYDPLAKNRGKKEFDDVWGNIPLEDDWRRRDKSDIFNTDVENTDVVEGKEEDSNDDEIARMVAWIKGQIPYSDDAKKEKDKIIEESYFALGKAYREKIQNYEKSIDAFDQLLQNYPEFEQKLDVYYFQYLNNLELNNTSQAAYYRDKILNDFPDTQYAQAISDPNFADKNMSEEKKLERYYEETYDEFASGNYDIAYTKAEDASRIFGADNPLRAKFALVGAMATGNIKGKEEYINALKDITIKYPDTDEKARANEILRFLLGDEEAFTGIDVKDVDDEFKMEDDRKHYIAILLPGVESDVVVNAKVSISNYNKQFFKLKKYQLSDVALDIESKDEVVLVRSFDNKEDAMSYYENIMKSKEAFLPSSIVENYRVYAITQRNYRVMQGHRSDSRYKVYFDKYYLGK